MEDLYPEPLVFDLKTFKYTYVNEDVRVSMCVRVDMTVYVRVYV